MRKVVQIPFLIMLAWLLLFTGLDCFAGAIETTHFSVSTGFFHVGGVSDASEGKFADLTQNWSSINNISSKSIIALRVNDGTSITYAFDYSVTLSIVTYKTRTGAAEPTITKTLRVTYNPNQGTTYTGIDSYTIDNVYRVVATITGLTANSGPPPEERMLALTTDITVNRKYTFVPTAAVTATYDFTDGRNLKVGFNVPGAEEYDIEWTTINSGNPDYSNITTPANTNATVLDRIFRNNASRITSAGSAESIAILSTDTYLLARIRQVQYTTDGIRQTGDWYYNTQTANTFAVWPLNIWHEQDLNWQYSRAFAEEGKRKEVISYFDGTLRGRQTVTINNSDNIAVAQENIYDEFGRAAASILPAPFKEGSGDAYLHYIPQLNQNALGKSYTFSNVLGTNCEFNPDPLNVSSGASKYYSSANPFKSTLTGAKNPNDYVPDAGGYPISITQYTPDNTGRIKVQGGVGPAFQPGKAADNNTNSKTTKYYYAKPEQWELDQLFGNDAGYADHYLKNMVVDPNNQVSISYLNASGKTVATALAGAKPSELDALSTYIAPAQAQRRNMHILEPRKFVYSSSDMKLYATTTFMNTVIGSAGSPDTLAFDIQTLVDKYKIKATGAEICSSCYYGMTVTVKDDCGTTLSQSITTAAPIGALPPTPITTVVCTEGTYTNSIIVPLQKIGAYYITIEFALSDNVIEDYTDRLISLGKTNGDVTKEFNFIRDSYLNSIDVSGCYNDCHTCKVLLGPTKRQPFIDTLRRKFVNMSVDLAAVDFDGWAGSVFDTLVVKCNALQASCDAQPCSSVEDQMLADVSPGGQYALFDSAGNAIEPAINVITKTTAASGGLPNWRYQFPTTGDRESDLVTKEDGSVISPYDATFSLLDLITYWKPEWARKFLTTHPENCNLIFCVNNAASKTWDNRVKAIDLSTDMATIPGAAANQAAYSSSLAVTWLLNLDPFFISGPGNAYRTDMLADLTDYSGKVLNFNASTSLTPPVAIPASKNLSKYVDFLLYCQDTNGTNTNTGTDNWANCTPNDVCRVPDREWQLYKNLYMQLKDKYFNMASAQACNATNTCPIGQPITYSPVATAACPTLSQFSIRSNSGTSSCGTGSQSVIISHGSTPVGQAVTLTIYYPPAYDSNTSLTRSLAFGATETQKTICIPESIPLEQVLIQAVTCGSGGSSGGSGGSGGSGSGTDPDYLTKRVQLKILDNVDDNSLQDCYGASLTSGGKTVLLFLRNTAGQLVTSPNDVVVTFKGNYLMTGSSSYVNNDIVFTIPANSSSIAYNIITQPNSAACNFPYQSLDLNCVSSIQGAGDLTVTSWECTDFTVIPPSGTTTITPPTCAAVYSAKISRFPVAPISNAVITSVAAANAAQAAGIQAAKDQATDICTGNAKIWMDALAPGIDALTQYSQAERDARRATLQAKLIEICAAGGDEKHGMGASDLNGLTPVPSITYLSFGAAIKGALGITNFTATLNPYLISSPPPYLVPMQATPKTVASTDATICGFITNLTGKATAQSKTLYNYLVDTYHQAMTLTQADLDVLQKGCTNCKFILAKTVTLPVFLDPGGFRPLPTEPPGSINATLLSDAETQLGTAFNGALSTTDPNYPLIYTNFMNQRWGFALNYEDYVDYKAILVTTPLAVLCNKLAFTAAPVDDYACVKTQMELAIINGKRDYAEYIAQIRADFRNHYIATCKAAQANAYLSDKQSIYHYTLYYYDQADNLVRTVPPEGVTLITPDRFKWIDDARDVDPADCQAAFDAVKSTIINNDKPGAFTALSNTLNNGGSTKAVEFWTYNPTSASSQVIQQTPDQKYLFQLCYSGNRLAVQIYSSTATASPASVNYTLSNQFVADITAKLPLHPWAHLVVQSSNFGGGALQVYLNGVALTALTGTQAVDCTWAVTAGASSITYPDNISTLKHLRLYSRAMTTTEIANNAASNCFLPTDASNMSWYRFNVPNPGDPTTIASNTDDETRLSPIYPDHTLPTTYAYNSTKQVVRQYSPDGGNNKFWYDLLSRLVVSQNDKQKPLNNFSYTIYDATMGRITEVGQKNTANTLAYVDAVSGTPAYITESAKSTFLASGTNTQITRTYYDDVPTVSGALSVTQNNLRKRVAATMLFDDPANSATISSGLYYNYDMDGNVKTIYRQMPGLGTKKVDYEYDLLSGKVNFVRYQDQAADRFYYQYKYDAENRLTAAWTGTEAMVDVYGGSDLLMGNKKMDAQYSYYLHGPLARMELGDVSGKVQGVDYAYTLQGWLKGVNSNDISPAADMGNDGNNVANNNNATIAKDVYGYSLNYYGDNTAVTGLDYTPVKVGQTPFSTVYATNAGLRQRQLFNGNITASSTNIPQLSAYSLDYKYTYDQLNRLTSTTSYHTTGTGTPVLGNDYNESLTYDGNGNIITLNRAGTTAGGAMDALQYNYSNRNSAGKLLDNKLTYLDDAITTNTAITTDLKDQSAGNYDYDAIGNLIKDVSAGITDIQWTVYGKIKQITKGTGNIAYTYDPAGERVSKKAGAITTYYVRDAQGHTLAIYDDAGSAINWREQHLYGSSRLGLWTPNVRVGTDAPLTAWQLFGSKQYELSNHLGNVLATITDRRTQNAGSGNTVASYNADIATAQNYYAFGSLIPGRSYAASSSVYRYGFNGKENDNEVKKDAGGNNINGAEQDYGMRIYDPRVGRFLSEDPITRQYPELTPYQFASNSPIENIDLDGLEKSSATNQAALPPFPTIGIKTSEEVVVSKTVQEELAAEAVARSGAKELLKGALESPGFWLKYGARATGVGLFLELMLTPTSMGKDDIPKHIEKFKDPSKMTEGEAKEILDRINKGQATGQDKIYERTIRNRFPNEFGAQLLNKPPSSQVLSFNLLSAGINRPDNVAAHHIVAGNDPRAEPARLILQREGIDINEAINGVFLPRSSKYEVPPAATHSTLHTNDYYDKVNKRLSGAQPGKVGNELKKIGKELSNGTF